MAEMAASGCVQVRYGIESGSNRTLERIRKGFTIEQAFDVATRSLRQFPGMHTSFMWGFPSEEVEEYQETLQWVAAFEAAGATVLLFKFSPLPGSELYRQQCDTIRFSPGAYSGFVVTGHEIVGRDGPISASDRFDEISALAEARHRRHRARGRPSAAPGATISMRSAGDKRVRAEGAGVDGGRSQSLSEVHLARGPPGPCRPACQPRCGRDHDRTRLSDTGNLPPCLVVAFERPLIDERGSEDLRIPGMA